MSKNIAVVAADGRVAGKVIAEAAGRGWDVTAFGRRDENGTAAQTYIKRDIMDLTAEDLAGFDAVVDAFGAWTPETLDQHSATLAHLCGCLSGTDVRLLVVGGAGSLYVNPEHTATVSDGPDFPDIFKPLAAAMAKALGELRERDDVKWTYISPRRRLPGRRRAHRRIHPWRRGADLERCRRVRHQLRRLRHRHGRRDRVRRPHPTAHQHRAQVASQQHVECREWRFCRSRLGMQGVNDG